MPSLIKELTPTRVDLHRSGRISVHHRVAVRNAQTFVFSIPSAHATRILADIRLYDTRGTHPVLTLAAPPPTRPDSSRHNRPALLHWLTLHVGREVEVRPAALRAGEPWKLVGVLEGICGPNEHFDCGHPLRAGCDLTDEEREASKARRASNRCDEEGPYVLFVRVGDTTVARTVSRLVDVEIRLKTPENAVAATLPNAARCGAVLPVAVDAAGEGDGQLHISYHTGVIAIPLYELRYELDAAAVLHGGMKLSRAQVSCSVRIANYLPFPLRNSMVCLTDEFVREGGGAGFDYMSDSTRLALETRTLVPASPSTSPSPSPPSTSSSSISSFPFQAGDKLAPRDTHGRKARDNVNKFEFVPTETTKTAHFKQAAFERMLRERVSLQPGEIHVTHLFTTAVDISGVHCMTEHDLPEPTVRIHNTTGSCLEAGSWSIRHGAHSIATIAVEALLPGAVYNATAASLPFSSSSFACGRIVTVHRSVASARRMSHRAVALRGESLVVRDERARELLFELGNQDEVAAHEVYVLVENETERRLRAPTAAKVFDGVKTAPWERGVEPDGMAVDEPFGFIRFSFRLEPAQTRTLVVRQTVRNESRVALRKRECDACEDGDDDGDGNAEESVMNGGGNERRKDHDVELLDFGHVERLRRAGAPDLLVQRLRDVIHVRRELTAVDWTRAKVRDEVRRTLVTTVLTENSDTPKHKRNNKNITEEDEDGHNDHIEDEGDGGDDEVDTDDGKRDAEGFVASLRSRAARRVALLHAADEMEAERSELEERLIDMVQEVRVALASEKK